MATANLTAQRLRDLLTYDPVSGVFTRLVPRGNTTIGDAAGSLNKMGYLQIWIDGVNHKAHRLAWLYQHGEWPAGHIDHVNGIHTDNRIANLRDVSRSTNLQNQRKPHTQNTHGFLGVTRHHDRTHKPWAARININGRRSLIGYFQTPELAHAAYLDAKRSIHPGCTI